MQAGLPKQPRIWEQQFSATQSPQVEPSEGQLDGPQKPATQRFEQHSSGPPQVEPSGAHCAPQTPSWQLLEQHSSKLMQPWPSAKHASTHCPPSQVPLQQSPPAMQAEPSGLQLPHSSPQVVSACATHEASHEPWQQNGSTSHTAFTHALQSGSRGTPSSQG